MQEEDIKQAVRQNYARMAGGGPSCGSGCCGGSKVSVPNAMSSKIGYSAQELEEAPEGANLGLGCGNPLALASLKAGETVLDLGSGGGFDCFLASKRVGPSGKVIGVDMTPEMIATARRNARKGNYPNVEFRLGEIESLPVADSSVDVIISNCVVNLAPDKERVFQDAFRVLRPGGRMMIADILLLKALPDPLRNSIEAYVGCIAGATMKDDYLGAVRSAGFQDVSIMEETSFPVEYITADATAKAVVENLRLPVEILGSLANSLVSAKIYAMRPET